MFNNSQPVFHLGQRAFWFLLTIGGFALIACDSQSEQAAQLASQVEQYQEDAHYTQAIALIDSKLNDAAVKEALSEEEKERFRGLRNELQDQKDAYVQERIDEAKELVSTMSKGAITYREGDQQYTEPDGSEPWHQAGEAGSCVGFDELVFPGGTDFQLDHAAGQAEWSDAVFQLLDVDPDDLSDYRLSYETGSEAGDNATAKIELGLTTQREDHRVIAELEVNLVDGVFQYPVYVERE